MRMRLFLCFLLLAVACRARPDTPQVPAATPAPGSPRALSISSPRAGDTMVEGRTYVIRWQAPAGSRINLGAVMGGKDRGYLLTNAPATTDSLLWTVPVGFITGFGPLSFDQMRLRIEDADSSERWAETGPFTITGAPRQ